MKERRFHFPLIEDNKIVIIQTKHSKIIMKNQFLLESIQVENQHFLLLKITVIKKNKLSLINQQKLK
jgi:hypothetical protein